MEKKLKTLTLDSSSILDCLPIAIQIVDRTGIILYSNAKCTQMHDLSFDDFKGKKVSEVFFKDLRARKKIEKYIDHLVKHSPPPTPFFNFNPYGERGFFPVRADWEYLFENDKVAGFACVIHDLSDQLHTVKDIQTEKLDAHSRKVVQDLRSQLCKEFECLTEKESQILTFLCNGYNNTDIAKKLNISPRTVEKHRENILKKTNHKSVLEAAVNAIARGFYKK